MSEPTYCSNPDHARPTPAIVHMSWPDGRYRPTTACIGDMQDHVRASVDEGHPVLLQPVTPSPYNRKGSTYLVWSNKQHTWWGPNGSGYTADVWSAGRYDETEAIKACGMRTWSQGSQPPEVMVLAPENGRAAFTLDDIRAVPDLMRKRIREATRRAIAERKAAETPVPA
ncbi:hypothetical protein [Streptosporangium roseum]|uniref:hypothetical protein n=1 Tax=Streptosporangium roseum TaxID=2001 RepID=UPI0004CD0955|nr:hypothetical protein [Streptosporangium roseum]